MTGSPRRRRPLYGAVGGVVALSVWALLVGTEIVNPDIVPSPWAVAAGMWRDRTELLQAAGQTLQAAAVSMGIAASGGILLGVLAGSSRWVEALSSGLTRLLRAMPSVALIPVAVLVLGLGQTTIAVLGAYAAFWPVFLGSLYGVRNLDPLLLDTGRTVGLTSVAFVHRLVLPAALPSILAGVRVAVGVCLVVCVSVEVVLGNRGLGGFVVRAQYGADNAAVYAGIVAGGALGLAVSVLFRILQVRTVGWAIRSAG